MKKIAFLLLISLVFIRCSDNKQNQTKESKQETMNKNSEKEELQLGMNYDVVPKYYGEAKNKNEATKDSLFLYDITDGNIKAEVAFYRNSGYYFNEKEKCNTNLINEIRVNFEKETKLNINQALEYINSKFLKNTAKFKLLQKYIDKDFPNTAFIIYEADNTANLKNVGYKIWVTIDTKDNIVESIDVTSINSKKLYDILKKRDDEV